MDFALKQMGHRHIVKRYSFEDRYDDEEYDGVEDADPHQDGSHFPGPVAARLTS